MVVWRLEKKDGGGPWFTRNGGLREGGYESRGRGVTVGVARGRDWGV